VGLLAALKEAPKIGVKIHLADTWKSEGRERRLVAVFGPLKTMSTSQGELSMKNLLIFACVSLLVVGSLFAQSKQTDKSQASNPVGNQAAQVEVEKDRFTGDIVVTLKPQMVYEKNDQFINLALKATFSDKISESDDPLSHAPKNIGNTVVLTFESQSKNVSDFADRQLNFIADGKRINCGYSDKVPIPQSGKDPSLLPGYLFREIYISALNFDALNYISNCKSVELKLGTYEMALNSDFISKLREYLLECKKQSPSQLKGRR
jgi:hypothetical protein